MHHVIMGVSRNTDTNLPCCSVVFKAHIICSTAAETRTLLEQMVEENRVDLLEARDKLERLQMAREDRTTDQEGLESMATV